MSKANLNLCYRGGNARKEPGYIIGFSYDAELVELLKDRVPHTHRSWNAEAKTWWVSEQYENVLDELFGNWYTLAKLQGSMF